MAEGEYRRLAPACGVFGCGGAVMAKALCTKHYFQVKTDGQAGPREQRCAQCATMFLSERKRMYCTSRCSWTAADRRAGKRPLAEYRATIDTTSHYFKCEWCGKDARRNMSGTNRARGSRNRWCSRVCLKAQTVARRADAALAAAAERQRRDAFKGLMRVLRAVGRFRAKQELEAPRPACSLGCAVCGKRFGFVIEKWSRVPEFCSVVCSRRTPAAKRAKAIARKAGKLKRRGAVAERFDPMAVFERDGWRCQICGVSTPKSRRGTCHANAPELDHVVPISRGGQHTRANTQCACRACNGAKGAGKPVGQIGLFSAVASAPL